MRIIPDIRSGAKRMFTSQQIVNMIEHVVEQKISMRATALKFGCSNKTVAYYVNKYYYGHTEGKTYSITIGSKMNDMDDIPYEEFLQRLKYA